jgi:protein-tyrosine phosphatase
MSGLLPLSGGVNFRDVGGLPAADGRVRHRTIFRSGRMNRLTADDQAVVEELGIRLICDFRSQREQAAEPYHWLPSSARVADWGTSASGDVTQLRDKLSLDSSGADGREVMLDLYRNLPERHADRYAVSFKAIAEGEVPAVLACTPGKDRTGMAVALQLSLVGVPREAVIENYALSEKVYDFPTHFHADAERAERAGRTDNPIVRLIHEVSPAAVRAILASPPDYVATGLAATAEHYGSIEGYARERLGLDDRDLARLREFIIE